MEPDYGGVLLCHLAVEHCARRRVGALTVRSISIGHTQTFKRPKKYACQTERRREEPYEDVRRQQSMGVYSTICKEQCGQQRRPGEIESFYKCSASNSQRELECTSWSTS